MNATTLREALIRQPFESFWGVCSNNETFEIRHPKMAHVMHPNLLIFYDEAEDGFAQRFHPVSLLHIIHLQLLDTVSR